MNVAAFWDIAPCSLDEVDQHVAFRTCQQFLQLIHKFVRKVLTYYLFLINVLKRRSLLASIEQ
jgi:hypothetical protein